MASLSVEVARSQSIVRDNWFIGGVLHSVDQV